MIKHIVITPKGDAIVEYSEKQYDHSVWRALNLRDNIGEEYDHEVLNKTYLHTRNTNAGTFILILMRVQGEK